MAIAFAAVIAVGSLTGAQLKQDKQKEEVRLNFTPLLSSSSHLTSLPSYPTSAFSSLITMANVENPLDQTIKEFRAVEPAEQIRTLEEQRRVLMGQRGVIQRKIDVFQETVKERNQEQEAKR